VGKKRKKFFWTLKWGRTDSFIIISVYAVQSHVVLHPTTSEGGQRSKRKSVVGSRKVQRDKFVVKTIESPHSGFPLYSNNALLC